MSETRGIFGLNDAVEQKLDNEWVPLNQVFHGNTRFSDGSTVQALHNIGYIIGGGYVPGSGTYARETCERIQFANDTSSLVTGTLNEVTQNTVSTSSLTAAYRSGGGPGSLTNCEKITYSTETYNLLPSSANLSFSKIEHMGGGNSTQGYFVGGYTHGGSYPNRSSTDKITYSNDTMNRLPGCNQPASTFPSRKGSALSATTHGYFGGSGQPGNSSMDKMVYSVETLNLTPTAFLSTANRRQRAGSSSFGYFQISNIVEKLVYSTDTLTRVPSNLSLGRSENQGTGGPTAGYFAGGIPGRTDMEKVNFATDTPSAIPSHLTYPRQYTGAVSAFDNGTPNVVPPTATPSPNFQPGPNAGYLSCGQPATAPRLSSTDKLDFSSDTNSLLPSANSPSFPSGINRSGQAHSSTKSYFAGGVCPDFSPSRVTVIEKLTYSTEAKARIPGANLNIPGYFVTGASSPSAGYFGGLYTYPSSPGHTTRMDKLTFSNDSVSYTPSANLSLTRREIAATGNTTHSYFAGGTSSPGLRFSTTDKLTFSNDTTAVSPSSALSVSRSNLGAIGSDTQGYFGGGSPGFNSQNTDKITYSTDTTSLAPTASAGQFARSNYASTGNIASGYWIGGYSNPLPTLSSIFKLNYASESSSLIPSATMSEGRYAVTGSSSRMDGVSSSNIV